MSLYQKFRHYYLSNYYMMILLSIILLTCIGSVAVYLITLKGMYSSTFLMMCLSVIAAGSYLSVLLAQMRKNVVFLIVFIALCVQLLLIVINLL
ncbi:MAG: hypothetical protein O3A16_06430 [Bacteroidetes bacterium]|nr:hypothetical protein [Bacteroidota bacterium]MDA1345483.1 hypothetical protein [Bacteroidota bacterium]